MSQVHNGLDVLLMVKDGARWQGANNNSYILNFPDDATLRSKVPADVSACMPYMATAPPPFHGIMPHAQW